MLPLLRKAKPIPTSSNYNLAQFISSVQGSPTEHPSISSTNSAQIAWEQLLQSAKQLPLLHLPSPTLLPPAEVSQSTASTQDKKIKKEERKIIYKRSKKRRTIEKPVTWFSFFTQIYAYVCYKPLCLLRQVFKVGWVGTIGRIESFRSPGTSPALAVTSPLVVACRCYT